MEHIQAGSFSSDDYLCVIDEAKAFGNRSRYGAWHAPHDDAEGFRVRHDCSLWKKQMKKVCQMSIYHFENVSN